MEESKITLDVSVPSIESFRTFQKEFREKKTIYGVWFPISDLNTVIRILRPILTNRIAKEELPFREGFKLLQIHSNYLEKLTPKMKSVWNEITEIDKITLEYYKTYSDLHYKEVMEYYIPPHIEKPTAWETIGHILHLNLREEQMPYRYLIGEILLSKIPEAKTVLTKTGSIDSIYRTFPHEIIAGEKNTETVVVQHGNHFQLDFAKVYWNSRLEGEHKRLVDTFSPDDIIVDMFAGIGPFVIPAAKKGCLVFANDLNPHSYYWLQKNVKRNKVSSQVTCFNMDGRDFISNLVLEQKFTQVIMNLPASAVEFLDVVSICKEISGVRFHVYGFVKHVDKDVKSLNQKMVTLANQYLPKDHQISLDQETTQVHLIRLVSTNKYMMRLSFII